MSIHGIRTFLLTLALVLFASSIPQLGRGTGAFAQSGDSEFVSESVRPIAVHVDMQSLRAAPGGPVVTVPEGEPQNARGPAPGRGTPDPVIQFRDIGVNGAPGAPLVNISGLPSNASPPDTIGDIGPNHFVQMVNATQFQIWNKAGVPLTGALNFGNLWPIGNTCRGNVGDPVVVYDHLSDRWLLAQLGNPNNMCFAISRTPDPTAGTWFLYNFPLGIFPDYPKIGVWTNAYTMTTYEGNNLGIFVFDRLKMVAGLEARYRKRTIPALGTANVRDTRILPVDLDGSTTLPLVTPSIFARTVDGRQDPANPVDRLEVYEYNVNWLKDDSGFSLTATLLPAPFDTLRCNRNGGGIRDCIPEPSTTATVDSLSNRPMMQLKLRDFGTYLAMVFNQTIDVSASMPVPAPQDVAGIRFYELRKTAGVWALFQQGTFAPQPGGITSANQLLHRWMGSTAMDKMGNIALGYSVDNDDDANPIFPGIRYTGRLTTDPPGTMGTEQVIRDGINSQTGGFGLRWGDYSALSVDPTDNCTFWYTTHLAGAGGTGTKPTQIASFKFANCN